MDCSNVVFSTLLLAIITFRISLSLNLSCRDENNQPVEWFIAYKFPHGFTYSYMSPDSQKWILSKHLINISGAISNTFSFIFDNLNEEFVFGMYNDEKPVNRSLSGPEWWGHMKGLFAFTENGTGFWLIHSVPKLSNRTDKFEFPATAEHYAQHFLCVTLNYETLQDIADQLLVSRPLIQAFKLPDSVAHAIPALQYVMNHSTNHNHVPFRIFDLHTYRNAFKMRHFSKSKDFNYDLYQTLVAPNLNRSLLVETWSHSKDDIPSNCSGEHQILNVRSLFWREPIAVNFHVSEDHSKWAITIQDSPDSDDTWVCLGDINHTTSQFYRGGGTMCINNASVGLRFQEIVKDVENCTMSFSRYRNEISWMTLTKSKAYNARF